MVTLISPTSLLPKATARGQEHRVIERKTGQAIGDFSMIEAGDKIMVCISGGKDSYVLLDVLMTLQKRSPVAFALLAVNVDQGWPNYDTQTIAAHLRTTGVDHEMIDAESIAQVVRDNIPEGNTPCSLCSRLRRGVLYSFAKRLGCTKIALGHHRDDLIETALLNMIFSGSLASMPPVLRAKDGDNTVIRPMAYVPEQAIATYAATRGFPIVSCSCPTCGLPHQKRQVIKRLLEGLDRDHPGAKNNMLAALKNVKPSHLLDRRLWDGS